jgi:hypothetical protein
MNRAHVGDGRDLFVVGLDPPLKDNEAEEHASRNPKNTFFLGFSLIPLALRHWKVLSRSVTRSLAFLDLATMSSTYASMVQPMRSPKTWSMHHWYVAPMFLRLNDMVR